MSDDSTRAEEWPRRGRAGKRRAILRAARAVFGRLGYAGAGVDGIAVEAGVSTRTIYNHFDDKEHLFAAVLVESSAEVARTREALVERFLDTEAIDLEEALVALARAWARPLPEFVDHFALVRRMRAESDHFPPGVVERWRDAGPLRVRRALAARFAALARGGRLDVDDPALAATHFLALLSPAEQVPAEPPLDDPEEAERIAAAGARRFLHGYGGR